MAAIPAKIAGVERIVMTTPPEEDGSVPDVMLAAAKIAGITEIVKLGGAQAIAALAYGTQTVPARGQDRRPRQHLRDHRQAAVLRAGQRARSTPSPAPAKFW